MKILSTFSAWVGRTFAIWTLLFALAGFFVPALFINLKFLIVPLLGIIMFGMGLTLNVKDFSELFSRPLQVLLGTASQFLIMPLVAWLLTKLFALDPMLALGVILVGSAPGGTSSNVITYLSKGDVALSVTITGISTLLAPLVTPLLLKFYAGEILHIALLPLMVSIAKMVLIPIGLGLLINHLLKDKIKPLTNVLPLVSVVGIVMIVAIVVAASKDKIVEIGLVIAFIVMLHNIGGYMLGYLLSKLFGFELPQQKAISIEVGMQNSGLAAALASANFHPVAAVPAAMFSVWHNISGAILANYFSQKK